MPSYQQRVRDEALQLSSRLTALQAFLQTPVAKSLPAAERDRLRRQARYMRGYLTVLDERIAAF